VRGSTWPKLWGLVVLAVLFAHAMSYLPFLADDAFISLRYSERLIDGQGLTWNDGERVEGYSNLLWVLLCAALGWLGLDLITAVRALGLGSAAFATWVLLHRYRRSPPISIAAGMALALSGPLAAWSVGGLESPLVAALLAWALATVLPLIDQESISWKSAISGPAIPLALLCWTRPDGALLTVAIAAGLIAAHGPGMGTIISALRISAFPAGAYLAQLAFRLAYYGEWVPNVAFAKLGFTGNRVSQGVGYLAQAALWLGPLVLPALALSILLLRRHETSARARFLLVPFLTWSVYVVAIGGDIFPARRHVVPLLVLLAFLLAEGLHMLERHDKTSSRTAWALTLLFLVALGTAQWFDPENERARQERWEWDSASIGRMLHTAFEQQQPLLAVDTAGALPYFSQLPALDMLGLNDRYLARHRPEDFGHGWLGHELGDGDYVLQREPDLIWFCGPEKGKRPCFRSGVEMVQDPRFSRWYRLATFQTGPPDGVRAFIWIRVEGGRLGFSRERGNIQIPGYLFVDNPRSVITLDTHHRPGISVNTEIPAGFQRLEIDPGRWVMELETGSGMVRGEVRASGTPRVLGLGNGRLEFEVREPGAVDLFVGAYPGTATHLLGATLRRVQSDPALDPDL